ncbi:nucleoside phosphorylase [Desulfobacterales bacterium HSG16]|nr:nucleoside phosphorylase [Desulfobacterales bacterium HSG16]
MNSDSIVKPIKGKNPPDPGRIGLVVATAADIPLFRRNMECLNKKEKSRKVMMSRLYKGCSDFSHVSLTGPFMGAPYAAMILETLISWGASDFIFFGWCGAISSDVHSGDIILVSKAIIDEGLSSHYRIGTQDIDQYKIQSRNEYRKKSSDIDFSAPSPDLFKRLADRFEKNNVSFITGPVWTTDAIFRETPEKVLFFQSKGALAVEMEMSAMFSVAEFAQVNMAGVLVVSDELSTLSWQPGFNDDRFHAGREAAIRVVCDYVKSN